MGNKSFNRLINHITTNDRNTHTHNSIIRFFSISKLFQSNNMSMYNIIPFTKTALNSALELCKRDVDVNTQEWGKHFLTQNSLSTTTIRNYLTTQQTSPKPPQSIYNTFFLKMFFPTFSLSILSYVPYHSCKPIEDFNLFPHFLNIFCCTAINIY